MRKLRKEQNIEGEYGKATVIVDVMLNIRSVPVTWHNPSTHDEDVKQVWEHQVVGSISAKELFNEHIRGDNEVLTRANQIFESLINDATRSVNQPQIKGVKEKFLNSGFKEI